MASVNIVRVSDLNDDHTLINHDSGNKAMVYGAIPDSIVPGLVSVETEFGILLLDPELEVAVV
jgi:hypothetical protein